MTSAPETAAMQLNLGLLDPLLLLLADNKMTSEDIARDVIDGRATVTTSRVLDDVRIMDPDDRERTFHALERLLSSRLYRLIR